MRRYDEVVHTAQATYSGDSIERRGVASVLLVNFELDHEPVNTDM